MGDSEFHPAGGIGFDQVDEVPGNGTWRNLPQQCPQRRHRYYALQQPPNRSPSADVDRAHFQYGAVSHRLLMEIQVIDAHHLSSEHINHLLIEQVASEQQHAFQFLAGCPFTSSRIRTNPAVDGSNRTEGQQAVAGFGLDDDRGHAGPVFLRNQGQFAHTSTFAPSRVEDRSAKEFGQGKRGHHSENTQVSDWNPDEFEGLSVRRYLMVVVTCQGSSGLGRQISALLTRGAFLLWRMRGHFSPETPDRNCCSSSKLPELR